MEKFRNFSTDSRGSSVGHTSSSQLLELNVTSCTRTRARTALQAHKTPRKKRGHPEKSKPGQFHARRGEFPEVQKSKIGNLLQCPHSVSTRRPSSHTTVLSDTPTMTSWNFTDRVPPPESTRRKVTVLRWTALVSRSRGHPPLTLTARRSACEHSHGNSPSQNPLREIPSNSQ